MPRTTDGLFEDGQTAKACDMKSMMYRSNLKWTIVIQLSGHMERMREMTENRYEGDRSGIFNLEKHVKFRCIM